MSGDQRRPVLIDYQTFIIDSDQNTVKWSFSIHRDENCSPISFRVELADLVTGTFTEITNPPILIVNNTAIISNLNISSVFRVVAVGQNGKVCSANKTLYRVNGKSNITNYYTVDNHFEMNTQLHNHS